MQGLPEVDKLMAPLIARSVSGNGSIGSEIYNPIYEAVAALVRNGGNRYAERLCEAIDAWLTHIEQEPR